MELFFSTRKTKTCFKLMIVVSIISDKSVAVTTANFSVSLLQFSFSLQYLRQSKIELPTNGSATARIVAIFPLFFHARRLICNRAPFPVYSIFDALHPRELPTMSGPFVAATSRCFVSHNSTPVYLCSHEASRVKSRITLAYIARIISKFYVVSISLRDQSELIEWIGCEIINTNIKVMTV